MYNFQDSISDGFGRFWALLKAATSIYIIFIVHVFSLLRMLYSLQRMFLGDFSLLQTLISKSNSRRACSVPSSKYHTLKRLHFQTNNANSNISQLWPTNTQTPNSKVRLLNPLFMKHYLLKMTLVEKIQVPQNQDF